MAVVGMSPTRDRYPTVAPQLLASDDEGESLVSTWMISSEIPPPRPNVKQNLIGHAFSWWMVFTVVVCVCWGASYAWMWTLPSAKPVTATTDQFSEGRAMRYLDDLAGTIALSSFVNIEFKLVAMYAMLEPRSWQRLTNIS